MENNIERLTIPCIVTVPVSTIEPEDYNERQAWLKSFMYWSQSLKKWVPIGQTVAGRKDGDYATMLSRLEPNACFATMNILDMCYWMSVLGMIEQMLAQVSMLTCNTVADSVEQALWGNIIERAYTRTYEVCRSYMERHTHYRTMCSDSYEPLSMREDVWREEHYAKCIAQERVLPYYTKHVEAKSSATLRRLVEAWANRGVEHEHRTT